MIITTTQDLEAVACCTCAMPTSPAPRIESLSVTAALCAVKPGSAPSPPSAQEGIADEEDNILYQSFTWALAGAVSEPREITNASESGTWTAEPIALQSGGTCGRHVVGSYHYDSTTYYDDANTLHSAESVENGTTDTSAVPGVWNYSGTVKEWDISGTLTYDEPYSSFQNFSIQYFGINTPNWSIGAGSATLTFEPDEVVIVGGAGNSATFVYAGAYTVATAAAALSSALSAITTWPDAGTASTITATLATDLERITAANATKAKFRIAPPVGFSTVELPRTTYEAQWDYVMFPANSDPPTLVSSASHIWDGDSDAPWSDYFEIPVPTVIGEVRRVNLMILSYRSARIGQKPTAHGEVYAI